MVSERRTSTKSGAKLGAKSGGKPAGKSGAASAIVRGPHAKRSAAMRVRVIDAAIDCLTRLGYGATTLQVVIDAAGVSRGAVLHHFPTRVDLMIAVAEYAAGKQNRQVARLLANTEPGMDRFVSLTMATWDAMVRPPSIALIEIMMGSRSDPELGARFPAVNEALETYQRNGVWEQAKSAGITDKAAVEAMIHLHNAAMRGLVLDLMFSKDRKRTDNAMKLLLRYKKQLTADLVKKPLK